MSTKDEKDWLRAILEGRVKPGDAEWERIWQDENFTGVRRVLREVGMGRGDKPEACACMALGGSCDVAFVIGWNFMDKFTGEKGPSCGGSDVGDRSRNTSCRVVYGTGGKDRFVLACW